VYTIDRHNAGLAGADQVVQLLKPQLQQWEVNVYVGGALQLRAWRPSSHPHKAVFEKEPLDISQTLLQHAHFIAVITEPPPWNGRVATTFSNRGAKRRVFILQLAEADCQRCEG
jgi:hypothetical protein